MSRPKVKKSPFVPAGKIAKFVSSVPGKSFIVHLKKSPETVENDNIEVTLRRNLFSSRNEQEIVVENLEKSKISFNPQPLKQYNNGYNKLKIDNDHLINVFSSVGGNNDHDSINFNWVGNCESQDLNGHDNYLKADPHESKFCNIPRSNISQMMDSVEGCGDFYFHKQILASRDEPLKSIVGNSFNMIPAFSMTEEFAEPLRPSGLEINDIADQSLCVPNNLQPFQRDADCDMMLIYEFKNPIDAHNQ